MFAALPEERIYLAPSRRPGELRRKWIAVAVVFATYTLAGATLVYDGGLGETPKPAEEIPVEIVVEPPPPPAPPPPPPAAPAPKPDVDLAPAFDAPRAGTADTDTGDKEKASPPAPAAQDKSAERDSGAEAKAEAPKPEAPPTPEPTQEAQPAAPAPPLNVSEGEVPAPAPPAPEPTPSPTPQPQASEAASPAKPEPPAGKSAPLFASVPDVDFSGTAMKSPVSGGNSRAIYTSILLGSILPHFHKPHGGRSSLGGKSGVVNFSVDAQGRLLNRYISEESGLPELDRAAIDAVGAASPFPPPPAGLAHGTFSWFFGKQ